MNSLLKKSYFALICAGSVLALLGLNSCNTQKERAQDSPKTRQLIDTTGFAQYPWQMDSIINRIDQEDKPKISTPYKAVISPHDDYAYAAGLYHKTLAGIQAKTILLIGVAHRAKNFNLQDQLLFGDYDSWLSAKGKVKISEYRDELLKNLSPAVYAVHDSMMQLEHSLEALVPFLQHKNPKVELIPILVPYMKYETMVAFSDSLSDALAQLMKKNDLNLGKDLAVLISNDAIHYGDTDWGGKNMAAFGTDSIGNKKAVEKDLKIISECLVDELDPSKIQRFNTYTVMPDDYKEYRWTWCGRYSVPFGLLLATDLNQKLYGTSLTGTLIDYRTSLYHKHLPVSDLGMGTTAPANSQHWVGYVGIEYR